MRLIIFSFFVFAITNFAVAQDQYEFATVFYSSFHKKLEVSIGDYYEKTLFDKSDVKGTYDMTPAIKRLNKMSLEGWEIININDATSSGSEMKEFIYHLRRKKIKKD
jgi:hypothetical protein